MSGASESDTRTRACSEPPVGFQAKLPSFSSALAMFEYVAPPSRLTSMSTKSLRPALRQSMMTASFRWYFSRPLGERSWMNASGDRDA